MSVAFKDLNLDTRLFSAIEKLGYQIPTPIQSQCFPPILENKDVAGLAQTGTGKTAAYLIPLLERWLRSQAHPESAPLSSETPDLRPFKDWKVNHFILILVPTRELVDQVTQSIEQLTQGYSCRWVGIYGGTGYEKQKEAFAQHVDFVVATPGRLIDLYKEHHLDLKQVRAVVFDEADRMFDLGFKDDMKFILQRIPRERQFLVFSATLNFDVLNVAYQFGADPIEISLSKDQPKAENVKDEIFHVGHEEKAKYMLSLFKKHSPKQAIIFSNYKHAVESIAHFLNQNGIPAMAISSLLSQPQRTRVIELFKADNEKNVLVATDVAARGLDIKGVDLVLNFDLPSDPETYVHRIGRTGRAGAEGMAFSLVGDKDVDSLQRIEEFLKHKLPVGWLESNELVKEFIPFHDSQRRPRSSDRGQDRHQGGGSGGFRRSSSGPGNRGPRSSHHSGRGPAGGKANYRQSDQNSSSGPGTSVRLGETSSSTTSAPGAPKHSSRTTPSRQGPRSFSKGSGSGGRGNTSSSSFGNQDRRREGGKDHQRPASGNSNPQGSSSRPPRTGSSGAGSSPAKLGSPSGRRSFQANARPANGSGHQKRSSQPSPLKKKSLVSQLKGKIKGLVAKVLKPKSATK